MKIILLNGPPGCGKDTIGNLLRAPMSALTCKFAQPIIDHMFQNFGVSCADGADKSAPVGVLNGMSRRQYAIAYSEEWVKPKLGIDWFGRKAVRDLRGFHKEATVVFTDSGFVDEALPVVQGFGIDNVVHVKITRPGYGFNDDSRSYWHLPNLRVIEFDNNCELGELFQVVRENLIPEINKWPQSSE